MTATENPELWAFLKGRRQGETLTGTIPSIERFGVFVALDEGPDHLVFPGVGFISHAELSWTHFDTATAVVQVGQHVACEILQVDTWNGKARLSLKAMQPDHLMAFAQATVVGFLAAGRRRYTLIHSASPSLRNPTPLMPGPSVPSPSSPRMPSNQDR